MAGSGAEATSYDAKTGDLVLNIGNDHGLYAPTTLNAPTAATYAPTTGVLRLTIASHGCSVGSYIKICLLYTSPSPRDKRQSRMPSSA